jgi:hypothetical protein
MGWKEAKVRAGTATLVTLCITLACGMLIFWGLPQVPIGDGLPIVAPKLSDDLAKDYQLAAAQHYESTIVMLVSVLFGLFVSFGVFFREYAHSARKMDITPAAFSVMFFLFGVGSLYIAYQCRALLVAHAAIGAFDFKFLVDALSYLAAGVTLSALAMTGAVIYEIVRVEASE